MAKLKNVEKTQIIRDKFVVLNMELLHLGFTLQQLRNCNKNVSKQSQQHLKCHQLLCVVLFVSVSILFPNYSVFTFLKSQLLGTRCILPNNYFIWEGTRPISNCSYCMNLTRPIILMNLTRAEFALYAYTSKPVIVKRAVTHWRAMKSFDFNYLKHLYENTAGAYESVEEDCQFLHFHSDFTTLRDVFAMEEARAELRPGEKPWYVGWCSYNTDVLERMRQHYLVPHFLPVDSELSNREYIFMGYDQGANMHLDFISRLMWQAQISGNKTWHLIPAPECEHACESFSFYVEPGDAMLLDTRVWYHGTTIAPGQFSLTIQSEYS